MSPEEFQRLATAILRIRMLPDNLSLQQLNDMNQMLPASELQAAEKEKLKWWLQDSITRKKNKIILEKWAKEKQKHKIQEETKKKIDEQKQKETPSWFVKLKTNLKSFVKGWPSRLSQQETQPDEQPLMSLEAVNKVNDRKQQQQIQEPNSKEKKSKNL